MKILKIKNSEIIQFTRDLNLSWVILKRNFINGVKNKNTYNIIDVEKDSFKKIKIKNNFFKGYLMVSNFLEYSQNNKLLKIIHIDGNKNNHNIQNFKLVPLLEHNEEIRQIKEFPKYYVTSKGRIFKDTGLDFFEEKISILLHMDIMLLT